MSVERKIFLSYMLLHSSICLDDWWTSLVLRSYADFNCVRRQQCLLNHQTLRSYVACFNDNVYLYRENRYMKHYIFSFERKVYKNCYKKYTTAQRRDRRSHILLWNTVSIFYCTYSEIDQILPYVNFEVNRLILSRKLEFLGMS